MKVDEQQLIAATEVAQYFGVTVATIRRWVRQRRIPFIRPSRRIVRFHLGDVEAALAGGAEVKRAR